MENALAYDVIIVGGGPAGCAVALTLSKSNPNGSFLLLDDSDPLAFKIGESLPPEASRLLHHLSSSLPATISQQIGSGIHSHSTGNASSWASATIEERHAILNPFGHGWHLDRASFDESLRQCISRSSQRDTPPQLLVKGKFTRVERDLSDTWVVSADVEGRRASFHAKWVLDATGRKASVATKLGATTIKPHPLLAFYAVFATTDISKPDNDRRTLIEAVPEGWFYSSLIASTRVVVFHTLPNHSSAKKARREEGFLELLRSSSTHISSLIREHEYEIAPGRYPVCTAAGSSYLDKVCDATEKWVAVGDAAAAFDPLSSQGMMTSLEMGYAVGRILSQQLQGEGDASDFEWLHDTYQQVRDDYERQRAYYYGVVSRFQGEPFWDQCRVQKAL